MQLQYITDIEFDQAGGIVPIETRLERMAAYEKQYRFPSVDMDQMMAMQPYTLLEVPDDRYLQVDCKDWACALPYEVTP